MAKFLLPITDTERETMKEIVELDSMANWYTMLLQLRADRSQLNDEIDVIENQIKDAMGEIEVGTIGGEPVVRWTHVTTKRFSQKRANQILSGEVYASCVEESTSRRFTIVEA